MRVFDERFSTALSPVWAPTARRRWGAAAAQVREQVWADRDRGGRLVVDIDSTLVEVHSENKAGAAPHYKGGYGFGPAFQVARRAPL